MVPFQPLGWSWCSTFLQDAYGQIELDDLHDPEASNGIALEMLDRQRYFDGGMSNLSSANGAVKVRNDIHL